jgi:DNA-binding NarL/FixJ family response regulator
VDGILPHIDQLDVLILVVSESENISRVLEEIKLVLPISCSLLIITHAIDEIYQILLGSGRIFGIISIEYSEEELLTAMRAVANGLIVISPQIAQQIFKGTQSLEVQTTEKSPLSSREMQVLDLLAQGLANKQIADRLGLRPNTVKFYVTTIYQKIGASNRAEAVTRAIQSGILSV